MGTPEEKKARNEVLFRDANEKLVRRAEELVEGDQERPVPFLCECTRRECTQVVLLTLAEYEGVRAHEKRGFVLPGHEDPSVERVVQEHVGYLVAEKFGPAADVLQERDPPA